MIYLICGSIYKSLFGYLMLKSEKFLKLHTCSAMIVVGNVDKRTPSTTKDLTNSIKIIMESKRN
jgi:hypothetical protein